MAITTINFVGDGVTAARNGDTLTVTIPGGSGTAATQSEVNTGTATTVYVNPDTLQNSAQLAAKQATLVSGANIKTINSNSLLGSGDLVISGGGGTEATFAEALAGTGSTQMMTPRRVHQVSQKVYNVEAYGAVHDGSTDDTAAIQSAIQAAFDGGGGVVYFPKGVYYLSSPVDSSSNAQVYFPLNSINSSSALVRIKLLGEIADNFYGNPFLTNSGAGNNNPTNSVIIKSSLLSSGDVFGNRTESVSWGNFNFIYVEAENITVFIRSKTGSTDVAAQATAFNMKTAAQFHCMKCSVMPESRQDLVAQPSSTAYGFKMPAHNNWVQSTIDQCYVYGMYVGFDLYEHARIKSSFVDVCYVGVQFNFGSHLMHIDSICISRCRTNIKITGTCQIKIDAVSFEDDFAGYVTTPGWNTTVYDIEETSGSPEGTIYYTRVISGTGQVYANPLTRSKSGESNVFSVPVGLHIPIWSNSTRPSTTKRNGQIGFNTSTNLPEVYNGTEFSILKTASFLPVKTSNLLIHYDLDDPYSVKINGSNQVSKLYDKSGNGFTASNLGTASTRPVYTAGLQNGRFGLQFTGGSSTFLEYGKISDLQGIAGLTVFLVGGYGGGELFFHGASATDRSEIMNNFSSDKDVYAILSNSGSQYGTFAQSVDQIIKTTMVFDGSQSTNATRLVLNIGGVAQTLSFTGTIPATTESNASSKLVLGAHWFSPSYSYLTGRLCEMIVFKSVLSATQISDIEDYLLSKWAV